MKPSISIETRKINKLENENTQLLNLISSMQNEQQILKLNVKQLNDNMMLLSSMMAENAVIQNILTEQLSQTQSMLTEIDKLFHPNSYLKYDLMNETHN